MLRPNTVICMLQYLRIQNLALLDEVVLDLDAGFIAVTGETGAGKSVFLGALQLLSGARADKTMVRQGADACTVECALALPEGSPVHSVLDELGLPPCEDGALLIRRVLPRDKMPKILVNGALTTQSNLRRLGERWIDFHGPGEPQRLFSADAQRELLDLYAGHQALLESYREKYQAWRAARAEREALVNETALSPDEIDFLRQQLARIDACEISEEGIEALENDFLKVTRGQELISLAQKLSEGLSGEGGLLDRLAGLQRVGHDLREVDPSTAELASRLESLAIETEDLGREFAARAAGFEIDPSEAEAIQDRMNDWLELKRRYGNGVQEVLRKREEIAGKLARQGDIEGGLERIDKKIAAAEKDVRAVGAKLRKSRESAARDLAGKVGKALPALGFQKSGFAIEIAAEPEPRPHGDSRCDFLFSPNAGQELKPLSKIASSGEIARVMLALKTLLAEVDEIPVLVFDEVDANVGGEIGRAVGERLAGLSAGHQVFCVTHLPQVAGLASSHYRVEKEQKGKTTRVSIAPLHASRPDRLDELARMLGDRRAKSALAHAEELLERS